MVPLWSPLKSVHCQPPIQHQAPHFPEPYFCQISGMSYNYLPVYLFEVMLLPSRLQFHEDRGSSVLATAVLPASRTVPVSEVVIN